MTATLAQKFPTTLNGRKVSGVYSYPRTFSEVDYSMLSAADARLVREAFHFTSADNLTLESARSVLGLDDGNMYGPNLTAPERAFARATPRSASAGPRPMATTARATRAQELCREMLTQSREKIDRIAGVRPDLEEALSLMVVKPAAELCADAVATLCRKIDESVHYWTGR
jgi:hypothetical protein